MEHENMVDISGIRDISELCRLCLTKTRNMHLLYNILPEDQPLTLFDKLQRLSLEPLNSNAKYPSFLCLKCVYTLNLAYLLTEQIRATHKQLKKHFEEISEEMHKANITDTDDADSNICADNLSLRLSSDSASNNEENCGDTSIDSAKSTYIPFDDGKTKDNLVIDKCNNDLTKTKELLVQEFVLNENILDNVKNVTHTKDDDNKIESHTAAKRQFPDNRENTVDVTKKQNCSPQNESIPSEESHQPLLIKRLVKRKRYESKRKPSHKSALGKVAKKTSRTTCDKCDKTFSKPSNLRRHYPRCHKQLNIPCQICGKLYPNLKALDGHLKLKHEGMSFECKECKIKCKTACVFKTHMNEHKTLNTLERNKTELHESAMKTMTNIKEVIEIKDAAETVGNVTNSKLKKIKPVKQECEAKKYNTEMKKKQEEIKENQPDPETNQPEIPERIPEAKASNEGKQTKTNELIGKTRDCAAQVVQERTEKQRKHATQTIEKENTSLMKEIQPELDTQPNISELKIHPVETIENEVKTKQKSSVIEVETIDVKGNAETKNNNKISEEKYEGILKSGRVKPHKCGQCGKGFTTKFKLQHHMALHKKRSNVCDICGLGFVSKIRLDIHRMKYPGSSHCSLCDATFLNARYLNMHLRLVHPLKM